MKYKTCNVAPDREHIYLSSTLRVLFLALFMVSTIIVNAQTLKSPNGNFLMNFSVSNDGTPTYDLTYKGKTYFLDIIEPPHNGETYFLEIIK